MKADITIKSVYATNEKMYNSLTFRYDFISFANNIRKRQLTANIKLILPKRPNVPNIGIIMAENISANSLPFAHNNNNISRNNITETLISIYPTNH